jgi:catechol 2,3-dioxygenase-like lactoylglutathione lyase family enzyme
VPTIRQAYPTLASLDIAATIAFYESKLGFSEVVRAPDFASVARDGVNIEFWLCHDPEIPKLTSCRVRVDGVDELHAEYAAQGVVHPNGRLGDRPWGTRDFAVLDDVGNCITFFERLGS